MHFPSARKCVLLNRVRGSSRHSERVRMRGWEIGRKEVGEENKRKKGKEWQFSESSVRIRRSPNGKRCIQRVCSASCRDSEWRDDGFLFLP